jgi:hypothetical protein
MSATPAQPSSPAPGYADYSAERRLALIARIEGDLALLRAVCIEPVSLKYTKEIDIEIRPAADDDRLLIGRAGRGYTVVNYTPDGLSLDVLAEHELDPVYSASLTAEDLESCVADAQDNQARLFTGNWNHLFGPGRAETQCRIVLDTVSGNLLAAQALHGNKYMPLSRVEIEDLGDSVINANEAHLDPREWGLEPCLEMPDWAKEQDLQEFSRPRP